MIQYTLFSLEDGLVISHGSCPPSQLAAQRRPGAVVFQGQYDARKFRLDLDTGDVVDYVIPDVQLNYQEQRRLAYPPITDQLDALWKGGKDEADMRAKIADIKKKIPKD